MAVTEKKAAKKTRFNIIDLLIVILVLAVVCTVFMRYDIADKIKSTSVEDNVRINLLIQRVHPSVLSEINTGDEFVWDQADLTLGKVLEVKSEHAVIYNTDMNGRVFRSYDENNLDISFTVDTFGDMTDGGYYVSGTNYIAPGCSVTLHNEALTVYAIVISMEQID